MFHAITRDNLVQDKLKDLNDNGVISADRYKSINGAAGHHEDLALQFGDLRRK